MGNNDFHKKYQDVLIRTFKVLVDIIKQNGLEYFATGGTAIGAVRHQNIIPWDDDIDICMPRSDYNKFIKIAKDVLPDGYELNSIYSKDGIATYCKFVNKRTSFWEIENCPKMSGIFVDIFPFDRYDKDESSFIKEWKRMKMLSRLYLLCNSKFSLSYMFTKRGLSDKTMYISNILSLFIPQWLNSNIKKRIIRLDYKYSQTSQGKYLVNYYGAYGKKELFEASWFSRSFEQPFADFTIKLGVGNEDYLKQNYGDYMKLPPEEKRVCEHRHFYVNLSERISIEEARKRVNKGIVQEL